MNFTCILVEDERHVAREVSGLIGRCSLLNLVEVYTNSEDAINGLAIKGPVDIIFSDIRMPGLNGMQAAKLYRQHCRFLVYITAYDEYAMKAFEEHAAGYLLKPVDFLALNDLINTFVAQLSNNKVPGVVHKGDFLFLKGETKNEFVNVTTSEIMYLKSDLNYSWVIGHDFRKMTYVSLKAATQKLRSHYQFIRINKNHIINIHFIDKLDGQTIVFKNKKRFPIGNTYQAAFFDLIKKHSLNF